MNIISTIQNIKNNYLIKEYHHIYNSIELAADLIPPLHRISSFLASLNQSHGLFHLCLNLF